MSTLEMVFWSTLIVWIVFSLLMALLLLGKPRRHPEMDAVVAQADEARRAELSL